MFWDASYTGIIFSIVDYSITLYYFLTPACNSRVTFENVRIVQISDYFRIFHYWLDHFCMTEKLFLWHSHYLSYITLLYIHWFICRNVFVVYSCVSSHHLEFCIDLNYNTFVFINLTNIFTDVFSHQ